MSLRAPDHLLLRILRQPAQAATLGPSAWDLLVRQARHADLMPRLYGLMETQGLLEHIPTKARNHLESAAIVASRHQQEVEWEVRLISRALARLDLPVILLKGAAYVVARLPVAQGRLFSDVDILVPRARINEVEAELMLHGWASTHHDAYDQRYYRDWMHELPPMQHIHRMTSIDVHHGILPDTARNHPDPAKLLAAAIDVPGRPGLRILQPVDMVLHSACHLFHESETTHGLRDLLDLDMLLRDFSRQSGFWDQLIARARELDLERALAYALRYTHGILATPVPDATLRASAQALPHPLQLRLIDQIYLRILSPSHPSCTDWFSPIANRLLFIRGHWLRMPPILLARHLLHKAFIRPD